MSSRYLIREGEAEGYHPANHTGTLNRRLVGPGALESAGLEVLRGTLQPGRGAQPHAHPGIEQVCYVLSGQAIAEVDGDRFEMRAGDCCRFPPERMHSFTAVGDQPCEILVIYAPPYGENPANVIRPDAG